MHLTTILSLLTAVAPLAVAKQAADFTLSATEYESYGCQDDCQKAVKEAVELDRKLLMPDFDYDFYATAHNFSTSLQPGKILKFGIINANDRNVSSGDTVYRMQYTSLDVDGSVVPVTGFIAFPQVNARATEGKFPLVAWAHGTIGLFRGCASTSSPDFYDYATWQPIVDRGYAVVGTDFAGLGNNYTAHKYLTLKAHANDVYYSVKAARTVLGHLLTDEWMSAGHSQGGGAVWKLAESQYVRNDSNYLGSVALSPGTYVVDMLLDGFARISSKGSSLDDAGSLLGYLTFLPFAIKRGLPSFNGTLVAPPMQKRVELAEKTQVCIEGMFSMVTGLNETELIDVEGFAKSLPALKEWQKANSPALGDKSPAPVLVIQGTKDTSVLMNTTKQAWKNSCASGNEVHLRLYDGQEHSPTPQAAEPEWLGWIENRFFGQRTSLSKNKCSQKLRSLMAGNNTKTPSES